MSSHEVLTGCFALILGVCLGWKLTWWLVSTWLDGLDRDVQDAIEANSKRLSADNIARYALRRKQP